jgi:hypothetical protein
MTYQLPMGAMASIWAKQSSIRPHQNNVTVAVIGDVKIVALGKGDYSDRKEITLSA